MSRMPKKQAIEKVGIGGGESAKGWKERRGKEQKVSGGPRLIEIDPEQSARTPKGKRKEPRTTGGIKGGNILQNRDSSNASGEAIITGQMRQGYRTQLLRGETYD